MDWLDTFPCGTPKDDAGVEYAEDDPRCVCGVYRSEHALCGCPGFQTADDWKTERAFIESLSDWEYERIYG